MNEEQKHELRQQMYGWLVVNNLAKDKEEAKQVAKQNGFLISPTNKLAKENKQLKLRLEQLTKELAEYNRFRDALKSILKIS